MSYFEIVFSVWTGFFNLSNNFLLNCFYLFENYFYLSRNNGPKGRREEKRKRERSIMKEIGTQVEIAFKSR
jgi:hypothetical protein